MNTQPAPKPIANAIPATENTSPAPERLRGGSEAALANSWAITSLSARRLIGSPAREDAGLLRGDEPGLLCGEDDGPLRKAAGPLREDVGPSLASSVAAPGSAQ